MENPSPPLVTCCAGQLLSLLKPGVLPGLVVAISNSQTFPLGMRAVLDPLLSQCRIVPSSAKPWPFARETLEEFAVAVGGTKWGTGLCIGWDPGNLTGAAEDAVLEHWPKGRSRSTAGVNQHRSTDVNGMTLLYPS